MRLRRPAKTQTEGIADGCGGASESIRKQLKRPEKKHPQKRKRKHPSPPLLSFVLPPRKRHGVIG